MIKNAGLFPIRIKKDLPFFLLAILFGCTYFIPFIFAPGMHADGMAYATISRNMAEGNGSIWQPFFSQVFGSSFYEHPPLVFGIQSIFYKILGDHLYVEKLYCLFCLIISTWLLAYFWFLITNSMAGFWLAFIFWIIIPQVTFTYGNNFLENTMGIFCFGACCTILLSFQKKNSNYWLLFFSGFLIFSGCLCKGPFALFPLALPGIYWMVFRKIDFKQAVLATLFLFFILIVCFSILLQWPMARHDLYTYFNTQVYSSLAGKRGSPGGRFYLLNTLVYNLKPVYIATGAIFLTGIVVIRKYPVRAQINYALFFLLMGLSINLAYMVSARQLDQYELCAYAFYAMAFAAFIHPYVDIFITKFMVPNQLVIKTINLVLCIGISISIYFDFIQKDQYAVDKNVVHDLNAVEPYLTKNSSISLSPYIDGQWELKASLYRKYHISVTEYQEKDTMIVTPGYLTSLKGYKLIAVGEKYSLIRRL